MIPLDRSFRRLFHVEALNIVTMQSDETPTYRAPQLKPLRDITSLNGHEISQFGVVVIGEIRFTWRRQHGLRADNIVFIRT
ncbi:hypothetical protein J6590_106392 [Homalodisca vitripennis]|nr:hypothetical protein J6590_106392 [Homalodisca vitripennis]